MTPHSYAISLENTADMLAEALWERWEECLNNQLVFAPMDRHTRKSLLRTRATIDMILEGDIRSPMDMAAEVEGRVSE